MKKSLLLAILFILSLSSFAQNLPRLVSQIDSFNDGGWGSVRSRYDSTRFFYTGLRRNFDSTLVTRPTETGDTPLRRVVQHFNSIDSITEVISSEQQSGGLFETAKVLNTLDAQNRKIGAVTLWNNGTGWDTNKIETYVFDNNDNIIEYTFEYPGGQKDKYWHQYDANNNWLGYYQAQYDTIALVWDTVEHFALTYNVDNNRVSGTIFVPQSGSWLKVYSDTNVYSGNNAIYFYVYSYNFQTGIYGLESKDSNVYNSNNDMVFQLRTYMTNLQPPYQKTFYTYDNAHHLIQSLTGQVSQPTDSLGDMWRYRATYNNHGQISTLINEGSADSGKTWSPVHTRLFMQRFHYEDEPIYVSGVVKNISAIELYPNPASSAITINASFNSPEQIQMAILDIKGNVMMQWNEAPTKQLHKMIPLQFLSAGNYVLVLKGKTETQSRMFTVNR